MLIILCIHIIFHQNISEYYVKIKYIACIIFEINTWTEIFLTNTFLFNYKVFINKALKNIPLSTNIDHSDRLKF